LVAKNGKVVYEKGFGTANIELGVPMKHDMVFRIGSITKQYTAIAILQLIEQGKIALKDSIQKFIKGFAHKEYTITIENLLTHTSGIKDYEQLDAHIPNAIRIEFPTRQIIDILSAVPLDFPPSTKYNYSNSNYFILGSIIEQVSGKSYKKYLEEILLDLKAKGMTIALSSHDMPFVRNIQDRIYFMEDGQIIEELGGEFDSDQFSRIKNFYCPENSIAI